MADLRPILLVEDSPKDLELTLAALEKCQLANEIIVARDGEEALDYLYARGGHADRPDGDPAVVLLDLKLPKIDGLEVLEQVKGDANLRHIPIVMISAYPDAHASAAAVGADAFVAKPFAIEEMLATVAALLPADPGS